MKTYKMKINGNEYEVAVERKSAETAQVKLNGVDYVVEVDTHFKKVNKPLLQPVPASITSSPAPVRPTAAAAGDVKSPLPGSILDVYVREGDSVQVGQKLMMLEAMKMENNIEAEADGVVKKIYVSKGTTVLEGDPLISIG